jgi:hypothetical protein
VTRFPLAAPPKQGGALAAPPRRGRLGQGIYRGPWPAPGAALPTRGPGPCCRPDRRHGAAVRIHPTSFIDPRPAASGCARGPRPLTRRRRLAAARRCGGATPVRVSSAAGVDPETAQPLPEEAEGLPDRGRRHQRGLRPAARRGRRGRGPQGREDRCGEQRGDEDTRTLHGDSFAGGDLRHGRDGRRAPPSTNVPGVLSKNQPLRPSSGTGMRPFLRFVDKTGAWYALEAWNE